MPIYKDDCVYTFDTPESPHGLDVCLNCGVATSPDPQHDFTSFHAANSGHTLYVNIRKTPRSRSPKAVKLAVSAEKEADLYETETFVKDLSGNHVNQEAHKAEVDRVLNAESYAQRQEIQAWELEIQPCEHVLLLQQDAKTDAHSLAKCAQCDLDSNLWLCLQCGTLSCGRPQFGGGGGNGHGLAHFEQTNHPLAVKLGSITPEGQADVYCYTCDEEVKDPQVAEHLGHWGIDIATRQKTEKSMTELQVEQNAKWDFRMTVEGEDLKPVMGPHLTGLRNLGNTCYLNSVMQCLFALPAFYSHFPGNSPQTVGLDAEDAPNDLLVQLNKLQDGLNSGRYAKVDFHSEAGYQRGLAPTMFKYLIGKNHPEFATTGQQDAFEFLTHLTDRLQTVSRTKNRPDPTAAFAFETERRLECVNCKAVRYKTEVQENLAIAVPIEALEGGKYRKVTFDELLRLYTAEEDVEYSCATCQQSKLAKGSVKFRSFPQILIVNARRFRLENWVPTKVDVPVEVPEGVELDSYLSKGVQPNENVVEDEEIKDAFVPDDGALAQLLSMGFPQTQAEAALKHTKNDVEAAMEYVLNPPSAIDSLDPVAVAQLESMGFTGPQAAAALKANPTVEAAIEWLFAGNGEDSTEEPAQSSQEPRGPAGDATLPARYRLRGLVCHKGTSVHVGHYVSFVEHEGRWYLFNDEKVVEAGQSEETQQFGYVYFFERI